MSDDIQYLVLFGSMQDWTDVCGLERNVNVYVKGVMIDCQHAYIHASSLFSMPPIS